MRSAGDRTATVFGVDDGEQDGFKLGHPLGRGTLATVDAANWLGIPVAIKRLRPPREIAHPSTLAHAVSDFENEAKVNEALGFHPNVVGFLGRCRVPFAEKSAECDFGLVFERIEGGHSLDVTSFGGGANMERTLSVALCVARGLAHAHRLGIMHRDVKPSNVLVTSDGVGKVCDWGLAVETAQSGKSADTGTNEYMA
jgi:eukaryotic-like serine/threonine-protein kinase